MKMLRYFSMLVAMFVTFGVSAAVQYDYDYGQNVHNDGYSVKAYSAWANFYFEVLENTSLSFTTDLSSTGSKAQNFAGSINEVGYYVYTRDDLNNDVILYKSALDFVDGAATIDSLEAGQYIGFYTVDDEGNVLYSTKSGANFFGDGTATGNVFNGRDGYGAYNSEDKSYENRIFAFTDADGNVMGVLIGTGAPNGQPLPGVLAVLVLGGASVAFKKRFAKKA